jgi:PAS domain S-box-containing protein
VIGEPDSTAQPADPPLPGEPGTTAWPAGTVDLEALVAFMPDAVVVVDAEGTIVAWNDRTCDLLGYEADDLVGQPVELLVPERLRHLHRGNRAAFGRHPRARSMGAGLDLTARRKDGSEVAVDISLAPIITEEGMRVLAAVRDVTDRRTAAAANAALAAIVQSSQDGIIAMTLQGVVTSWNPGATTVLGYDERDVLGRHISMVVPEARSEDLEVLLAAAQADERVAPRDSVWRAADGREVDIALSVSGVRTPDGRLTGFSALIRDVSERKAAEDALRRHLLEEQLRERQQAALAEIRLALLSGRSPHEVNHAICTSVRELFQAEQVVLGVLEDGEMVVEASDGEGVPPASVLADPLVGSVRAGGQAAVAGAGSGEPQVVLCAPVVSEQRVVGVLAVVGSGEPLTVDRDLSIAAAFADQAALAVHLERAREDRERLVLVADRDRIARDLHDLVIQRLFAVGMGLQSAVGLLRDEQVAVKVSQVVDDLDATIREIRTVIFELGAPPPDQPSLRASVLDLAARYAEPLGFDPVVRFQGPVDLGVDPEVEDHLLAVLGEALANVARHASAGAAWVDLRVEDHTVQLLVEDDGVGIGTPDHSSGLSNMARRAEEVGGAFEVGDRDGGGTRLVWSAPR